MIDVRIEGDPNTYQFPDDTPPEIIRKALSGKFAPATPLEGGPPISEPGYTADILPKPKPPVPPTPVDVELAKEKGVEESKRLMTTAEQFGIPLSAAAELAKPTTLGGALARYTAEPLEATKLATGAWPLPLGEASQALKKVVQGIQESAGARTYVPRTAKEMAKVAKDLGIAEEEIKSTLLPPKKEIKWSEIVGVEPPAVKPEPPRGMPTKTWAKDHEPVTPSPPEKATIPYEPPAKFKFAEEPALAAPTKEPGITLTGPRLMPESAVAPPARPGEPGLPYPSEGKFRFAGEPPKIPIAEPGKVGGLGEAGFAEVGAETVPLNQLSERFGYNPERTKMIEESIPPIRSMMKEGGELYITGSTVRESAVGHVPGDLDYVLFNPNVTGRGRLNAGKIQVMEYPSGPKGRQMFEEDYSRVKGGRQAPLIKVVDSEAGGTTPGLLPHMASAGVGAAVGGAVSPEGEKWQGALVGGGAGLVVGRLVMKKLLKGAPPPRGLKDLPGNKVELPPIPEGKLTTPIYKPEVVEAVGGPASEAMAARGVLRDPTKTMTTQIMDEVSTNPKNYKNILKGLGVTEEEFLGNLKTSLTKSAQDMNRMSQFAKRLDVAPELEELLSKAGKEQGGMDAFMYWWKRADNVRRALLVSQLSTAMRNAEVQTGRFVIDAMEQGIASVFQKGARAVGVSVKEPVGFFDGVEGALNIFQRNKAVVNKIIEAFPESKIEDRLLHTYMSDVGPSGGTKWSGVDKVLNTIGWANRTQEFIIRRAVFVSKLAKTAENKGIDLREAAKSGQLAGKLTEDEISAAIQKSLEFTFAEHAGGTAGRSFVNAINAIPGATWILPFPRFLVNSIKFQYQYSPLGLMSLFSKSERAALAEGNMKVLSRATVGGILLGAAYEMRNSEYAGEKAWEVMVPGTKKPLDTRPYNPLVGYLILADLAKRAKDGTLYRLEGQDLLTALMGGNIRAGAGLFAVDQILNSMTTESTEQNTTAASDILKGFAGQLIGGLATPINQVKEFLAGMDDFNIKNTKLEPLWGPTKVKIPGVEAGMEPSYSPTHAGPRQIAMPAVRQATGLSVGMEKNPVEKELDRLQFIPQEINPSTGIPKLDNLIAKEMGVIVQEDVVPVVTSKEYLSLSNAEKAALLLEEIRDARKDARQIVLMENPDLEDQLTEKRIPKREKAVLKEQGEIK